jgi:hypothetical protein
MQEMCLCPTGFSIVNDSTRGDFETKPSKQENNQEESVYMSSIYEEKCRELQKGPQDINQEILVYKKGHQVTEFNLLRTKSSIDSEQVFWAVQQGDTLTAFNLS